MEFLGTMDESLLVVIIGALFIGASLLFGWLLFYLMRSREKTPSRRKTPSASQRDTLSPALAEKAARAPGPEKAQTSLQERLATDRQAGATPVEMVRLLRDRITGALVVEVEGQKYRRLSEIKDGRVGRQVLQAAADLVRFTEVIQPPGQIRIPSPPPPPVAEPVVSVPPAAPSTLPRQTPADLEREPPVPRTPAPPAVEREFLESLRQQRQQQQQEEAPKPSLSPIEFFRRGFAARRSANAQDAVSPPRSLAEEIEEILQRFIRTYPTLVGKEVHVGTGPGGGIRIQVENEYYNTPDDIPDAEIRGIIKAAIQEWEKS